MDLLNKALEIKQAQRKANAAKKLAEQGIQDDNALAKVIANPLYSQAQTLLKVGKQPVDAKNILTVIEAFAEQAKKTRDGDTYELELILHGQISMLSALSADFMNKAIGGYTAPEVLGQFPQLPGEFANIALKCQSEMRKCIDLLHQIKNPKKPSTFIKNYVNQQLNQLQVEQQELKQQLEQANGKELDTIRTGETKASYQEVETVGEINGSRKRRR